MSEKPQKALLPAGLTDKLPPDAAHEAAIVGRLMDCLAAHGYQRVDPPLIEFEDNLLAAAGADMADDTFRIMDPVSQRMMGVRADMTMQVARIAATRLGRQPRPLRLCYAGDVLRVRGSQLRPERQFAQVGAELIGFGPEAADIRADVEIVSLAAAGLDAVGIPDPTIDLGSPSLVREAFAAFGLDHRLPGLLRDALDHKDVAAVRSAGGEAAPLLVGLLGAAGEAEDAIGRLEKIDLPPAARAQAERLGIVARRVRERLPELRLSIDPVENRGFEYHTAFSFAAFSRHARGELGRGGRYRVGGDSLGAEPGTGFTLFMDSVVRAAPAPDRQRTVFVPPDAPADTADRLRAEGWVAIAGLADGDDPRDEARRLGCSHFWRDGAAIPSAD